MKCLLAGSLFLNCLLLCALFWSGIHAHAARGGGGSPLGNGDVNGDGAYNLSDALIVANLHQCASMFITRRAQALCAADRAARVPFENVFAVDWIRPGRLTFSSHRTRQDLPR